MVGDVVLTPFPYTDQFDAKTRPCLVLADVGMNDWIVCEMTSRQQSLPGDLRISQNDMRHGTLKLDSWVRPGRLHTLHGSECPPHCRRRVRRQASRIHLRCAISIPSLIPPLVCYHPPNPTHRTTMTPLPTLGRQRPL